MTMKTCKTCNQTKELTSFIKHNSNRCKSCLNAYNTEWRRNNPLKYKKIYTEGYLRNKEVVCKKTNDYRKRHPIVAAVSQRNYVARHPQKVKAHSLVYRNIKSGILVKMPCGICGCEKVEAHHENYSNPLEVKWLCVPHHKAWHRAFEAEVS